MRIVLFLGRCCYHNVSGNNMCVLKDNSGVFVFYKNTLKSLTTEGKVGLKETSVDR